jgi:biopolymer transport protein TolR
MAEINITPFTDVVLVLLIIFMVTTPLILQSGIKVKLPQVQIAEVEENRNISITIDANGVAYVEGKAYALDALEKELVARVTNRPDSLIVLNADRDVKYDFVVRVLDIARQSGATKYALSTEIKRPEKK